MHLSNKSIVLLTAVLFGASACTLADVQVNVVSERTSLENQVLGSYNSLSSEVLLVASVRGVDPLGRVAPPPARSGEQQDAVDAVQVLSFHADDVDAFKRLLWVGENNQGLLEAFAMQKQEIPPGLEEFAARYGEDEFRAVVAGVNAARQVVMRRVVESNENLTAGDLPQVRGIFAKIHAENALAGDKIQAVDGTWTVKQ